MKIKKETKRAFMKILRVFAIIMASLDMQVSDVTQEATSKS